MFFRAAWSVFRVSNGSGINPLLSAKRTGLKVGHYNHS
jgi:hypothetical protein